MSWLTEKQVRACAPYEYEYFKVRGFDLHIETQPNNMWAATATDKLGSPFRGVGRDNSPASAAARLREIA